MITVNRLILFLLIPIACIIYIIFHSTLAAVIAVGIIAVGIVYDFMSADNGEEKKKKILSYVISIAVVIIYFIFFR